MKDYKKAILGILKKRKDSGDSNTVERIGDEAFARCISPLADSIVDGNYRDVTRNGELVE